MNTVEILTYNKINVAVYNEFHEEFYKTQCYKNYNDEQMGFVFDNILNDCISPIRAAVYTAALHYEFTDR
jgi:hypothetical protein